MQAACMLHQEAPIVKPQSQKSTPISAQKSMSGRTQAERREHTRAALLAAGRELFAARGFVGAGREDIVELAGVTRGALYHHFDSKEALFQAVYEIVEQELCAAVAVAAVGGTDPIDSLRRGAHAFLDAASTPEVRRIVLLDAPAVLSVETRRMLSERYGLGLVREALRGAHAAGALAIEPVEPLAHMLLAALHEAATVIADASAVEGTGTAAAVASEVAASMQSVVDQLLTSISTGSPGVK
jgi:AcrR family transcriptional regulator